MNRRLAIKTIGLAVAAATVPPAFPQGHDSREGRQLYAGELPFKLPPLPYARDALQPQIDAATMDTHIGSARWRYEPLPTGIHTLYVKNLNKTIAQHFDDQYWEWSAEFIKGGQKVSVTAEKWLEASLKNPASVPEVMRENVRNFGGGHYNHSLFWQMMKPDGGGEPKGELAKAIDKTFGSFGAFKEQFSSASLKLSGSGWCWLTLAGSDLKIETTQNEDTPLSSGREVLLGLDLWEHAYYLQYQNRRADYIAAWWNLVNWDFVAERYAKSKG